ncbi:anti-sigma-I factor RsgI family protein [Sulfobacillus thermosulfidooxidans]|uniref:anti-sigma-I factor RsgI family protein n=1 Tax=Sulfobacillus thermosulfidooxidans TaxID=28034 RepID=UPI0006B64EE6|nr:anti-sigma factor domain-containing protein [Sulfobacillus thermosulfidooxidans]
MGSRAVVIAIDKHYATVLLAGGQFKRIRVTREPLVVGQEFRVSSWPHFRAVKRAVGAAAALAALMMGANGYLAHPLPGATAVISIDIQPSINMVVGGNNPVVLQASGLDQSGRELLHQISLQGLPISRALCALTRLAKHDGYLKTHPSYIVLGAISQSHLAWFTKLCTVEKTFLADNSSWHGHLIALSMVTHKSLKNYAHRDVSIGRYLLWKKNHELASLPLNMSQQLQSSPLSVLVNHKLSSPAHSRPLYQNMPIGPLAFPRRARINPPALTVLNVTATSHLQSINPPHILRGATLPGHFSRSPVPLVQEVTTVVMPNTVPNLPKRHLPAIKWASPVPHRPIPHRVSS